jgi:hypothetical protein
MKIPRRNEASSGFLQPMIGASSDKDVKSQLSTNVAELSNSRCPLFFFFCFIFFYYDYFLRFLPSDPDQSRLGGGAMFLVCGHGAQGLYKKLKKYCNYPIFILFIFDNGLGQAIVIRLCLLLSVGPPLHQTLDSILTMPAFFS